MWLDVLPEDLELRKRLNQDQFDMIKLLGKKLDLFHRSLPDYKQLTESPFNVSCWWDPTNEDEAWNSGRSCLFSLDGYTSDELVNLLPKRNPLVLKVISKKFIEASLPAPKKPETMSQVQGSLPLPEEAMSVLS